ncbi:MAG: hypothetical protein RMZ69_23075 [Nostoc sp. ChiQUE01a]|nr:hypothetical protein [Nostoc sp. ChiQUE01a]
MLCRQIWEYVKSDRTSHTINQKSKIKANPSYDIRRSLYVVNTP